MIQQVVIIDTGYMARRTGSSTLVKWFAAHRKNSMKGLPRRLDQSGFVGRFCCLSGKGLCLLVHGEERHAKQ
jgi:hypothetical protein